MGSKVKLAACTVNQWALDFEGNFKRIKEAIKQAYLKEARYCLTSELSIPGYGCEDHYYESDTEMHCWEVLEKLLLLEESKHMICDVSMPVIHRGSRHNCRVIFLYKKILLIRPKTACANDANLSELRWFVPWRKTKAIESYLLPKNIQIVTGQYEVPIGDGIIETQDTCIGTEICEELWTGDCPNIHQSLDGVEIFTNGSGSIFSMQKLRLRTDIMQATTTRLGGVYLMSNQIGCDGSRLYFDGCSLIALNGQIVAQSVQFSLDETEVTVAAVDLEEVRTYRATLSSRSIQAAGESEYPRIKIHEFAMCPDDVESQLCLECTPSMHIRYYSPEEEIERSTACWLWDYLRRSGQSGFLLPLDGGEDSSAVACIVYSMCDMLFTAAGNGNETVVTDVKRIVNDDSYVITNPEKLCNDLLTTCCMSSDVKPAITKQRASSLAQRINSNHLELCIDSVVSAFLSVFTTVTGFIPKFRQNGGSRVENIALQNLQSRTRMVLAYLFAQLMQWVRGKPGCLLVLGSSNADDSLRGNFTKYGFSSADINPIGGISKANLRSFLKYFKGKYEFTQLDDIVQSKGEITQTYNMTYDELSVFGRLRKIYRVGPYTMFIKLVHMWKEFCTPTQVAQKVKNFFFAYTTNRHKMTTLTPALHVTNNNPDDNRCDLRPFLYNAKWLWQFRKIDDHASRMVKPPEH